MLQPGKLVQNNINKHTKKSRLFSVLEILVINIDRISGYYFNPRKMYNYKPCMDFIDLVQGFCILTAFTWHVCLSYEVIVMEGY